MTVKVFISWSGDLSQKLAETLRNWLPGVLQFVRPYFSPEDIEKGTKWSSEISKELESSNIGIICLTHDNTEKPWILFEAGALSKSLAQGRVCTLLFGIEPADVKGPLTSFQSTRFLKEDFKRMVATVNNVAGDAALEPKVLDSVFDMWWPQLEAEVAKVLSTHKAPKKEKRTDRDILEELLQLARIASDVPPPVAGIPPEVLMDLADSLDEFMMLASKEEDAKFRRILRRIEGPLRYLLMNSGVEFGRRYRTPRPVLSGTVGMALETDTALPPKSTTNPS